MSERITTDQISELLAQDKLGRVNRQLLQAFLLNPQAVNRNPSEYFVSVDHGVSLEEMIEVGRYDWKNPDISSKNFSVKGNGVVQTNLELVRLNKAVSTLEAEAHLVAKGLRAATLEELLAFGAEYPEIQRHFTVVAIGSSLVYHDGRRRMPYLGWSNSSGRGLDLDWSSLGWPESYVFLAVRK